MKPQAHDAGDDAVAVLLEEGPCDDCRHAARCAQALLACDAFAVWVAGRGPRHWQTAPRQPTREHHASVFKLK